MCSDKGFLKKLKKDVDLIFSKEMFNDIKIFAKGNNSKSPSNDYFKEKIKNFDKLENDVQARLKRIINNEEVGSLEKAKNVKSQGLINFLDDYYKKCEKPLKNDLQRIKRKANASDFFNLIRTKKDDINKAVLNNYFKLLLSTAEKHFKEFNNILNKYNLKYKDSVYYTTAQKLIDFLEKEEQNKNKVNDSYCTEFVKKLNEQFSSNNGIINNFPREIMTLLTQWFVRVKMPVDAYINGKTDAAKKGSLDEISRCAGDVKDFDLGQIESLQKEVSKSLIDLNKDSKKYSNYSDDFLKLINKYKK